MQTGSQRAVVASEPYVQSQHAIEPHKSNLTTKIQHLTKFGTPCTPPMEA